jgi:cis-3-alkyl-4-acyloxetan-2-one decarboxylase
MINPKETFDRSFPFEPHFGKINGFDMQYVDEGSGPTVLCLHGEPTWSYLYCKVIPILSSNYRIIAPGYMGFGKTGTPQDREYTATAHIDNLEALVKQLNLTHITLVVHDWGGPIGGGLALRRPELISRVVVMNTSPSLGLEIDEKMWAENGKESAWFGWAALALAQRQNRS